MPISNAEMKRQQKRKKGSSRLKQLKPASRIRILQRLDTYWISQPGIRLYQRHSFMKVLHNYIEEMWLRAGSDPDTIH
ncbi:hypothetical protein [Mesorhizobium amorphae]|uniref:hypothetical protein n=1 Tax=Mesorhizobium amorphae TaxID=71433 RepID=UPI0016430A32|nr:hypothetical protein [Mesorhizobium amorphae]